MSESIWEPGFNEGINTRFWTCELCGASVQRQGKEAHNDWHKKIERNSAHPVTADRFSRFCEAMDSD